MFPFQGGSSASVCSLQPGGDLSIAADAGRPGAPVNAGACHLPDREVRRDRAGARKDRDQRPSPRRGSAGDSAFDRFRIRV